MTGYYSNLALHISDATLKGRRRLTAEPVRVRWSHIACGALGAAATWLAALTLL